MKKILAILMLTILSGCTKAYVCGDPERNFQCSMRCVHTTARGHIWHMDGCNCDSHCHCWHSSEPEFK